MKLVVVCARSWHSDALNSTQVSQICLNCFAQWDEINILMFIKTYVSEKISKTRSPTFLCVERSRATGFFSNFLRLNFCKFSKQWFMSLHGVTPKLLQNVALKSERNGVWVFIFCLALMPKSRSFLWDFLEIICEKSVDTPLLSKVKTFSHFAHLSASERAF